MKPTKAILILSISTLAAYGIAVMVRQKQLVNNSCLALRGFSGNIGINHADINGHLYVKNNTDISVNILNYNLSFFINDMYAGKIKNSTKINIPSNSEISIPVSLSFNPLALLTNFGNLPDSNLRIKGTLSLNSGFIYLNWIKVDETQTIKNLLNNHSSNNC